jgi:hypothetical protein
MNNMYRRIGHGYSICPLSNFCDEAVFTPDWGAEDFNKCLISPDNLYYRTGDPVVNLMQWTELYKSIRNVNIFFQNYDSTVVTQNLVQRRRFRDAENIGRATKGAAMDLKARTLIYAASDLYNISSWANGYPHPELIGYTGGDRTARWQAAKDAANVIIETGWYSLYKPSPAASDSVAQNFVDLFTSMSSPEDIFLRYFSSSSVTYAWNEYNPGKFWGPNGYHNWGNNTPTLQLVDAYELRDGTKFDWSNPTHAAAPFSNRNPRFYATILYHGAIWRQRTADVAAVNPVGIIDTKVGGLDSRQSPYEAWNGTYTGFCLRKFIVKELDGQYDLQTVPWRFYRYTEILLNYAEAYIELGEYDEARTYIYMMRNRAGMPEIPSSVSGDELRQRYRNERRIELAFENHRFFDVRRWMIGDEAYTMVRTLEVGKTSDGTLYTPYNATAQNRAWENKAYLFPNWRDEMNKNNLLIQNPIYQ